LFSGHNLLTINTRKPVKDSKDADFYLVSFLTLWHPAAFGDFWKKKRLNARGFAWEYLRSCTGYGPGQSVKRRGKSSSLHSKKFFSWGCEFFVSDVITGGLLGHLGLLCLALGTNHLVVVFS